METSVYLDNNASTIIPNEVKKEIVEWINCGNPSTLYGKSDECKQLMKNLRNYIARKCGFSLKKYCILFTSCASESNNTIIRSVCDSYAAKTNKFPHVVTSQIEHKSILECLENMEKLNLAEVTYVKPYNGVIRPIDVKDALQDNTCLISIMHGNNETGAMNNIKSIGLMAKQKGIPFHVDAVQTFGKYCFNPTELNVDAYSVSLHKLHGPLGIGLLIISKDLVDVYELCPIIAGAQNDHLRGGTENMPAIAGAFTALKYNFEKREEKNDHILMLKKYLISELKKYIPYELLSEYPNDELVRIKIVQISPNRNCMCNTLLISVLDRQDDLCNKKICEELSKRNICIGTGSACNSNSSRNVSHVLDAMDIPDELTKGVIRISLSHMNTKDDIDKFVRELCLMLKRRLKSTSK